MTPRRPRAGPTPSRCTDNLPMPAADLARRIDHTLLAPEATERDMVMNIGWLLDRRSATVADEIRAVRDAVGAAVIRKVSMRRWVGSMDRDKCRLCYSREFVIHPPVGQRGLRVPRSGSKGSLPWMTAALALCPTT